MKNELKALIFDVQSYSTHDGPGIRTNVFFKGCPLRCLWCANPEGQRSIPELFYTKSKCVGCMMCAAACPHGAVSAVTDEEEIARIGYTRHDRTICRECTTHECVGACLQNALSVTGKWMTVDDVMKLIHRDMPFYHGKGGVTISGGDPLVYYEFVAEFLRRCKEEGINTAMESELCVPRKNLEAVVPYVDLFLTDIKIVDEQKHIEATGMSNRQILENLRYIGQTCPERACLRIPIIPGYTDTEENINDIARFCRENHFIAVNILPYHNLGASKHERLGSVYTLSAVKTPSDGQMVHIAQVFESYGVRCRIN